MSREIFTFLHIFFNNYKLCFHALEAHKIWQFTRPKIGPCIQFAQMLYACFLLSFVLSFLSLYFSFLSLCRNMVDEKGIR